MYAEIICAHLDEKNKYYGYISNILEGRNREGQAVGVELSFYVPDADIERARVAKALKAGCGCQTVILSAAGGAALSFEAAPGQPDPPHCTFWI